MQQKRRFDRFPRVLPAALFLLALLASSNFCCFTSLAAAGTPPMKEQPRQPAGTPRASLLAADLDALSDSAEEIFDLALAGKMDRIAKKLEVLKKYAASLNYMEDQANSILLPRLGHTIAALEQAVTVKDRLDTMRNANRITLIAATVAMPLKPSIPTEVSLLDYNGRELGIWSEVKKTERLSSIVMRMHLAWQTLMPKLIEHNGIKELRRFSEIMGRLESAKAPEEYSRLSRQVGAETDAMKAVFVKPAK